MSYITLVETDIFVLNLGPVKALDNRIPKRYIERLPDCNLETHLSYCKLKFAN